MAKVGIDTKELKNWAEDIKNLANEQFDSFLHECALLLASEFIQRVQNKTPIGKYSGKIEFTTNPSQTEKEVYFKTKDSKDVFFTAKNPPKKVSFDNPVAGKQGGTLRDGWRIEKIEKITGGYEATIVNSIDYASHVEYGHRIMNKKGGEVKGFKRGVFMMTNTEIEMVFVAPELLEKKLEAFLKQVV